MIVLPNTGREQAIQLAQRLHASFGKGLSSFCRDGVVVTASIGVTTIEPEDRSYEDTLKRADRALYEAKNLDKDRVVVA